MHHILRGTVRYDLAKLFDGLSPLVEGSDKAFAVMAAASIRETADSRPCR